MLIFFIKLKIKKTNFFFIFLFFVLFYFDILKEYSNTDEILNCLKNGKVTKSYEPRFRSFALTLHYYSPRAYNYLRTVFGDHLPSSSTIRSWFCSVDGSPGISSDALQALKTKTADANKNGKILLACLILDEMALHKNYQWGDNEHETLGTVQYGSKLPDKTDKKDIAREALVFLINGINEKFKIPVGYFLINKLKSKEKATLTSEIILAVSKTGIKVIGMTFDGLKGNITMCRNLGANFMLDMPFIVNPHSSDKVFLFWDAAHMEKLARNRLATLRVLYNSNDEPIEWKYFERLETFQEKIGCQLGNKLTKTHMQWFRKKMNVRMAVETLSLSVANAMEYLRDVGYEEFQGCDATVEYIKYMNNVFDTMNSKKSNARHFKRPVSNETKDEYFEFFEKAIKYISQLKIEAGGVSILETNSKMAYFGFIQNMKNIKNIYEEYISTGVLTSLSTFSLSQDHIELLFGRIRAMGGFNDNPTVQQFAAAYRKLQVHNDVTASNNANCMETYDGILTVSSRRPKLSKNNDRQYIEGIESNNNNPENDEDLNEVVWTDIENNEIIQLPSFHSNDDAIKLKVVAYIASFIEKEIIESKGRTLTIKCVDCLRVFGENALHEDEFLERKSNSEDILTPCASTVKICIAAENELQRIKNDIDDYKQTIKNVLSAIDINNLFVPSDFDHQDLNHKQLFISTIARIYLRKKMNFISRTKTRNKLGEIVRSQWKKAVHFKGQ